MKMVLLELCENVHNRTWFITTYSTCQKARSNQSILVIENTKWPGFDCYSKLNSDWKTKFFKYTVVLAGMHLLRVERSTMRSAIRSAIRNAETTETTDPWRGQHSILEMDIETEMDIGM